MIGFYGFNPSQNPLYSNLLGQSNQMQQPSYQNPLFSRLGGDNSFSRLQTTYSNVFNPEIIQAGMNAYNQGMSQFTPFDQAKFDADLKAKQDAEAAAKAAELAKQSQPSLNGMYVNDKGQVGTIGDLAMLSRNSARTPSQNKYNFRGNALFDLARTGGTPTDDDMKSLGIRPLGGK